MGKMKIGALAAAAGALFTKAQQYAKENPDKVRAQLDKVETAVNSKTKGKYASHVRKGSDMLGKSLGVPAGGQVVPGQTTWRDATTGTSGGTTSAQGHDGNRSSGI